MPKSSKAAPKQISDDKTGKPKGTAARPLDLANADKTDLRIQFAALPYRMRKGKPEILLVTSRRSKRWILPKGWPHDGMTPAQAAAQEAYEEAGVEGRAFETGLGLYSYAKQNGAGEMLPCVAMVYPLKVSKLHDRFPEKGQRKRRWFTPKKAAGRVTEPELVYMLRTFDPRKFT